MDSTRRLIAPVLLVFLMCAAVLTCVSAEVQPSVAAPLVALDSAQGGKKMPGKMQITCAKPLIGNKQT